MIARDQGSGIRDQAGGRRLSSVPRFRRARFLFYSFAFLILLFITTFPAFAQDSAPNSEPEIITETESESAAEPENESAGFNIDSLFETQEDGREEEPPQIDLLQQVILSRGFSLVASYKALGFIAPGWSETPWEKLEAGQSLEFSTKAGVTMSADLNLDIQVSDVLRIQQAVSFEVLDPQVRIKEFFFDYNIAQRVFIRAGQFEINWGQAHNFQFTNLLARIPQENLRTIDTGGNLYNPKYLRVNVPAGIGGFEGVISGRFVEDFLTAKADDFGYGMKYNFIQPRVDMDIGIFYHYKLPLRGFFSMQTTLFKYTELYMEGLVSVPFEKKFLSFALDGNVTFSGAIGALWTFFDDRLIVNAEIFYSGESDSASIDKNELNIVNDKTQVFSIMRDLNAALNLQYEPGGLRGLGLGLLFRWAFFDMSGQIAPALYLKPAKHVQLSVAAPIALGKRWTNSDPAQLTYYYQNTPDGSGRPLSIIFAISLNSEYRFGYYE